jgi:Uma2 family endonuclease
MSTLVPPAPALALPDHTQLPCSDGAPVENFQGHPESILLTDAIGPVLRVRYPDNQYCIGQNSGIYGRLTDPPLRGVQVPDWFLIPGVPPTLDGQLRRSYVMWQEHQRPLIVIEFVSGDGSEERDRTPEEGKFWIYEHRICPAFYAIYEPDPGRVEVYHLIEDHFEPLPPNERGHYPIPQLGVELGIWEGTFYNAHLRWLRWFDDQGRLLPLSEERAEQERQRAEQERQRAEQERQRAEQERQRAEQERQERAAAEQRAEQERQRAEQFQQETERLRERLRELGHNPEEL